MANNLSDFNKNGRPSVRNAEDRLFSDLNLSMPIHPNRKDIVPLTDLEAIRQAVKNIILTNKGERPFQPKFGTDITSYLFENFTGFDALDLQKQIQRQLRLYEPRVEDVTVQITQGSDEVTLTASIAFTLSNIRREFDIDFALNRLR